MKMEKAPKSKHRLIVEVTDDQWRQIRAKMETIGVTNFSSYARKMLIDGYVIRRDQEDLKALTRELAAMGRNLNQLVRRVNEMRSIYASDVADVQRMYLDMKRAVTERLVKMATEGEDEEVAEGGGDVGTRDQVHAVQGDRLH